MDSKAAVIRSKDRARLPIKQDRWYDSIASSPDNEEGLPLKTRILEFGDSAVSVSCGTRADTIYSSTPWYRSEEPVSVPGSCTDAFRYTGRSEGPYYGPRQRTGPTGRDVRDSWACLRHHTNG